MHTIQIVIYVNKHISLEGNWADEGQNKVSGTAADKSRRIGLIKYSKE